MRCPTFYQSMSGAASSARERAVRIVEKAARLRLHELKDNPGARTAGRTVTKATNQTGHTQGALERAAKPPLGWIWGDFFRPWHRMFPGERKFNADINTRRELFPLSLIELARLIDLGWIDPTKPIDLPALAVTERLHLRMSEGQCGIALTKEGASIFTAPVDIEVQSACQETIAAIERAGGRIRTAYYDALSLEAAANPKKWFLSGRPVPARRAPPTSLLQKYSDPVCRGYLATQDEMDRERAKLAQLMGYSPEKEPVSKGLQGKDKPPGRIFHGLPSGSIVSLADKKVFCPTSPEILRLYPEHKEDLLAQISMPNTP